MEGYYAKENLYNSNDKNENEKIFCPSESRLSVDSYLKKIDMSDYEGRIRIVGMPGNKLYMTRNIDRVVKVELVSQDGKVFKSVINEKIPLPKELRGQL